MDLQELLMSEPLLDRDALICREMLAHVPLFSHRHPKRVVLWDENNQHIGQEIIKHACVLALWQIQSSSDNRSHIISGTLNEWLSSLEKNSLDIIIVAHHSTPVDLQLCFQALDTEGLFIQLCESSFHLPSLKQMQQQLQKAGFRDSLPLNFFQPNFTSSWRSAVMACKEGTLRRPREKDIFNKPFTTHYYNLDMHKAAFALPEFMREELT